jgi:hypothetical protein
VLEPIETANWFPKVIGKDYTIGVNVTETDVDDPDQYAAQPNAIRLIPIRCLRARSRLAPGADFGRPDEPFPVSYRRCLRNAKGRP